MSQLNRYCSPEKGSRSVGKANRYPNRFVWNEIHLDSIVRMSSLPSTLAVLADPYIRDHSFDITAFPISVGSDLEQCTNI